jgi:hypothetical protein
MGYAFRIVGASHIEIVSDVSKDVRTELYKWHGKAGVANRCSVLYFDLRENLFYLYTKDSLNSGFTYEGSWSIGTVDTFFRELQEFAYEHGLSYTIPIGMSAGLIPTDYCATYFKELTAIRELATQIIPEWSEMMYIEWLEKLWECFKLGSEKGFVFWECH